MWYLNPGSMRRRELLGAGLAAGVAGLAGCSAVLGESQEAQDRIESGSTKLLEAHDELVTQFDRFGTLESEVTFDVAGVRSTLESAREDFDAAGRAARLDDTQTEVENLQRLTDVMLTAVEVGGGLAAAYNTATGALDSFGDEDYDGAVDDLEDASSTLSDAAGELEEASGTVEDIDPESIGSLDLDLDALRELVSELESLRTGYALVVDGFTPFTKGFGEFVDAETEFDGENYGAASDGYAAAKAYFDESESVLTDSPDEGVDEEIRTVLTGMAGLARVESGLSATLAALSDSLAGFTTAQSYVDASRYEDAVAEVNAADDAVSEARDHLEAARTAFDEVQAGEGHTLEAIDLQQTSRHLDRAGQALATLDEFATGMGEYIEGVQALDAGVTEAENEEYSAAASHFHTAAVRFGDAESTFRAAEESAGPDLKPGIVDLVCFTGALAEASRLYADGYSAAANGNTGRANRKIEEAGTALEQCESGSSASLAGPPLP